MNTKSEVIFLYILFFYQIYKNQNYFGYFLHLATEYGVWNII